MVRFSSEVCEKNLENVAVKNIIKYMMLLEVVWKEMFRLLIVGEQHLTLTGDNLIFAKVLVMA